MMEKFMLLKDILAVVCTALSIIITIVSAVLVKSKNQKLVQIGNEVAKANSKAIKIRDTIMSYVEAAEDFINYTGSDKKAWVITKVKEFCISNGLAYDETVLNETVESLIAFSKKVNASDAKRIEAEDEKEGNV